MKRSILLTVALSFFILGTGCRETEEISKEQYRHVMALAKEESVKEGLAYGSDLPSITFKVPKWISRRGKVTIHFRTHLFCRIPQMALKPGKIRRTAQRVIRRACRKADVAFKDFNQAHANYGRLGLTYSEEREELNGLLEEFTPAAHQVLDEKDISVKEATRIARPVDTAILARLDTTLVERASWLAFDMGLPLGGEYRIFIEIAENGAVKIDGETRTIQEYVAPILAEDPYRLVHIMPDPQLATGKLFELFDSLWICGTQRVAISNTLSNALYLRATHGESSKKPPEPDRKELIEILADDHLKTSLGIVNPDTADLKRLVQSLAEHQSVFLLPDRSSSCARFLQIANAARRVGLYVFFFYESGVSHRPSISKGLV